MEDILNKAVRNNAAWCDAVTNSHNASGQFLEEVWINRNVVPRFYPNVITLKPNVNDITKFLEQIPLPTFTIKDSYNSLNVAENRYSILFEAEWIALRASLSVPTENWKVIKTPEELEAWEMAWNKNVIEKRIFLPVLLDAPNIFFLAKYKDNQIIAGGIANIASKVVGLSNVFSHDKTNNIFSEICSFIPENVSKLPIVGYESEENLEQAKTAGFSSIGKLKIIQL